MGFHRKLVVQTNEAFSSSHRGAIQSMCNNLELITRWLIRASGEGKPWKLLTTVVEIIVGLWCNYCGPLALGMEIRRLNSFVSFSFAFSAIIWKKGKKMQNDWTSLQRAFSSKFFSSSIFKATEKKTKQRNAKNQLGRERESKDQVNYVPTFLKRSII